MNWNGWNVDQTKTQSTDLRIIQGHYPWCVTDHLGEHIALVKSQKEATTGFAKASSVNDRDNAYEIAELISAAPEMYEALSDCLAMMRREPDDTLNSGLRPMVMGTENYEDTLKMVIESARKALRKAKPN